jgi:LysR family malonate utilization transcriptional regulator
MPEQDITLRKLEIFLGYMETMNISKTAEIMNISPVSVHRAFILWKIIYAVIFYA